MANIRELLEKRAKLVMDARVILDRAEAENNRNLSSEEEQEYERFMSDVDTLTADIAREERLAKAELELRASQGSKSSAPNQGAAVAGQGDEATRHKEIFQRYLQFGASGITAEDRTFMSSMPQVRDMSAFGGDQSAILAPQEFTTSLLENLERRAVIRELATVLTVNTLAGFFAPTIADDTDDAEWTAELARPNLAPDMSFGRRELRPHQLAKRVLLPITLLQSSTVPVESIANDRLARKFSRAEENHFVNGNGAHQPLGLFSVSNFGLPSSRDVVCGDTSDFSWDGLIDAKDFVRPEYHPNCTWVFHSSAIKRLRKLKDGEGRYVWEPSVRAGDPDVILERPYRISDWFPSVFSTGNYVGMFGDFSYYWLVQFNLTYVQRLNELYSETNQIGIIGRRWVDAAPVLPEAFARLKLA